MEVVKRLRLSGYVLGSVSAGREESRLREIIDRVSKLEKFKGKRGAVIRAIARLGIFGRLGLDEPKGGGV